MERLLADLERRETELTEREREARAMTEQSQQRARSVAGRERAVRERERALEKEARQEARRYVLEARAEIERAIKDLRARGDAELEEAARQARQQAERLAAEQGDALARLDADEAAARLRPVRGTPSEQEELQPGDFAEVATLGGKVARVLSVRDGEAVVAVGVMKMSVPVRALTRTRRREDGPDAPVVLTGDIPDVHARPEIDLRGRRIDEIDADLLTALDNAIRADLRELRVIHGKGTGALRERVAELLRKDTRVRGFRLGAWNEGGNGVTVVEI